MLLERYSKNLGVSKMVQNRANRWTIVHGLGSILTNFLPSENLSFLASNLLEMFSNPLQMNSEGALRKIK